MVHWSGRLIRGRRDARRDVLLHYVTRRYPSVCLSAGAAAQQLPVELFLEIVCNWYDTWYFYRLCEPVGFIFKNSGRCDCTVDRNILRLPEKMAEVEAAIRALLNGP